MKNMILFLSIMTTALISTGCSVDFGTSSTKSEMLASKAEALGETFTDTIELLEPLIEKKTLSSEDQVLVENQLEEVLKVIGDLKNEEGSWVAGMAMKVAKKELTKTEKTLLSIQYKAENGDLEVADVKNILNEVSPDFEIKLFE